MKIKIVESGWAGYSGYLGVTEFKDGVSSNPVSPSEATLLGSILRIVEVDDDGTEGAQVSASAEIVRTRRLSAPVVTPLERGVENTSEPTEKPEETPNPEDAVKQYARTELEAIADEEGIKGLRKVGDAINVRGTSIPKMIDDILTAQNAKTA